LFGSQQLLPLHVPPVQHGCPAPPHATHDPPEQRLPEPHELPGQHACPVPPHATHEPPEHVAPDPHVLPPQHGWPTPPHATHWLLPLQIVDPLQSDPVQHG